MSPVPSAVDMAQELITARPDLFKDDYETLLAIAETMFVYHQKMDQYFKRPFDQDFFFQEACKITRLDAAIRLGINL